MQTAETPTIKGLWRVFLRSCTELSTAHGDSCWGVEESAPSWIGGGKGSSGWRSRGTGAARCLVLRCRRHDANHSPGAGWASRIRCWPALGLPNAAGNLFMVASTQSSLSLRRALPTRRLMVQFTLGSVHPTGSVVAVRGWSRLLLSSGRRARRQSP